MACGERGPKKICSGGRGEWAVGKAKFCFEKIFLCHNLRAPVWVDAATSIKIENLQAKWLHRMMYGKEKNKNIQTKQIRCLMRHWHQQWQRKRMERK